MKKMITVLTLVCLIATLQLFAQPQGRQGRPQQGQDEKLTDTQIEKIKTILSDYDAESVTAEDAKAIHEAFRKARLRGSKAVDEVIEDAGFDAKELRELAPPPGRGQNNGERQGRPDNAPEE